MMFYNKVNSFQVRYTIYQLRFFSDCSIRAAISIFHAKHDKLQLLNFYKANPAPFMLKYNLQFVTISVAIIMMIMMMMIGMSIGLNSSILATPPLSVPK